MNQILAVDDRPKSQKQPKMPNKTPADIKKVIRVFCILTILFGIAITGQGVYALVNGFNDSGDINVVQNAQNNITIEADNSTGKVIISGTVTNGVSQIRYKWNEDKEEVITKNGETQINEEIDLLEGNNILTVTIVDMRAREEEYTKEFKEDTTLPQIALGTSDDGTKIKITAKDTVALSYITYQWDDGEVQTITPQPGSEAQIEQEIEALSGNHKLTVTAVNTSNKTATKTQEVQGSTKPLAGARVEDKAHIVFYATDNDGLANLKFTINGQEYILPGEGSPKELEYVFEVAPGHYSMTVTAENIYGLEADTQEFVYDYQ